MPMTERAIVALRWIATLPAALVAGGLAHHLMGLALAAPLITQGIDLDNFVVHVCLLAASGMAMGGAFVYVGAYVAPSHKTHTAIVLAIIAALIIGTGISFAIMGGGTDRYWAAWQGVCILIGASATAIAKATDGFRNPLIEGRVRRSASR
jgi:hypothetical protein